MDLIRSISWMSASHLRLIRDDDSYIDRLSHRYTVAICVIFCIVVSTKQYAGDPIDCWVPAQFKASYEKYADSYCWIAGSWYTPMDKDLPLDARSRKENRIRYYQWVPFLLLFQAILCYIPRIVWRSLNVRSGLDLVNLVDAAIKYESVDKFTDREKIMSYIVKNVERYIGARKSRYERLYSKQSCNSHVALTDKQRASKSTYQDVNNHSTDCCSVFWRRIKFIMSTLCFWTGKRLGNYLVVLYMFVKSLWVTNAISQLFLLNRFIGNDYHAFGIEIIEMLLRGEEWHEMRHFPRVTYCDFKIREIGNQHDWTVQCVLRINLFNEVIYIFMWFWLCILALFSIIDFLTWTMRIIIPNDRLRFVKRHLDIYNCYIPNKDKNLDVNNRSSKRNQPDYEYVDIQKEKALIREFTFKYLKDDGIFAMRILASSASDLITTEIISELWKNFKQSHEEFDKVSLSSSSTHTSGSIQNSSQVTSAASSPSPISDSQNKPLQSSPTYVKKPFNYSQQSDRNAYSPFQPGQQQYYMNNNGSQRHNSNAQTGGFVPPNNQNVSKISPSFDTAPPIPVSTQPSLREDQNNSISKRPSVLQQSFKENNPNMSQRHIHLEHSNANPNAKDTHV